MRKLYLALFLLYGCSKHGISLLDDTPFPPVTFTNVVNVKNFGAVGNGITNDTHAFELAMDKADSVKLPVFIPIGTYRVRLKLSHDGLNIIGEQQPGSAVSIGSIILGKIDCNAKKNISIQNLGVDSRNQLGPSDDAAVASADFTDSLVLHQQFKNLSIIGDGYNSFKHGLLCQAGSDISIKNVTISFFYHGIAIRASNVNIDSVYANYCGFTSVVVKSDHGENLHTENVSVNHVTIKGDPSDLYNKGGAILIISYGDPLSITRNILVQNIHSVYGGEACVEVQQNQGIVSGVVIQDCFSENQGDNSVRACYDVNGGSNITFSNCTANNSLGYGFRSINNATNVKVINSFEKNSHVSAWTGKFTYLQLNGQEIIK